MASLLLARMAKLFLALITLALAVLIGIRLRSFHFVTSFGALKKSPADMRGFSLTIYLVVD